MEQGGMQETLISLLPIVFFIAIFYLLLIRPANVKRKKHQEMINALQKGDKIITTGGLICEVVKAEKTFFSVRLNDDTIVRLSREFIAYRLDESDAQE
ncbi:preprotein translocase subunit YajC [Helicobacter cinaedi PAGU611]|uniref:Sec translocon accessory complex subunit YajC n=1 Tax=Helicobacter cinaedi CCUG 18818 = ATCC BAA-847 TaxID=537971 RepID=A0AAI8QGQ9_9HELI|nr:preprotein translocase subunit YajC [Helicobacter cinaedi]EFR46501.1 preprotein translocase, YajC subunit [Helicobacter cinaedi CCUG 18818 = ATCC BAA-847]QOQ89930.1 preprotein translocase subunit YajC [Helicobacter cinaedi]BAM12463.1 preprotein translocase subunit YajC [Helicobacter cinaedi PAGU611]BAM31948.1 preprotein translocase subunit [Helicobacter cinaedi CCUG 18818 = ATCC BAA-847]BBB20148.1 preprotein translocase subunit YajC [Helicobacter cinaedi]